MISVATSTLVTFLLLLARSSALVMSAPIIGVSYVPATVRMFLAAGLAVVGTAARDAPFLIDSAGDGLFLALLAEIAVGLGAGLIARFFFEALGGAGSIASIAMGLGFASTVDPLTNSEASALSRWLTTVGLFFAVNEGVHQHAVAWFLWSSQTFSSSMDLVPYVLDGILTSAIASIVFAVRLGFPVLATVTLGNLALGVVGRFSPQINMQSLGLSIGIITGGSVVYFVTPSIGAMAAQEMRNAIATFMF